MQSLYEIWSRVIENLKNSFSEDYMDLWISGLRLDVLNSRVAVVVGREDFKCEFVKDNCIQAIEQALEEIIGYHIDVVVLSEENGLPDLTPYEDDSFVVYDDKSETEPKTKDNQKSKKGFFAYLKRPFSYIFRITEDINTYYGEDPLFKKTLVVILKLYKVIIVVLLISAIFLGGYFWNDSKNNASLIMSLNYEESAKGLNPNSTRFNIYEVKSKDVISQMLCYFGMEDSPEMIKKIEKGISIKPCNLKEFRTESYYFTTSYSINLKKPAEIKDVTAAEMLTYLNKAYKDKFYSSYTENRSILSFDIDQFDESEYLTISDLLNLKAQQLSKYLNMRKKQSKTFSDSLTGETFSSLNEKIDNFCNYDIVGYRSYVLETGISNNKVHYVRTLDYQNLMNKVDYDKSFASYDVRYDGISIYDESMISIVMIPTIDYEHKSYYMSKTKTGMDNMANQADNFLTTAQNIAKTIEVNNDTIAKINAGHNAKSDIDKANVMIVDMQNKLAKISEEIEHLDKEYIAYRTNDYITIKRDSPSISDNIQLSNLIVILAVLAFAMFALIFSRMKYLNRGDKK